MTDTVEQRRERLAQVCARHSLWLIRPARYTIGFVATRGNSYVWCPSLESLDEELTRLGREGCA
jgi:hypothetical protein